MNRTIAIVLLFGGLSLACDDGVNSGVKCRSDEQVACTCEDGSRGERACSEAECDCTEARCELLHAAEVDFGAVLPGVRAERELLLENAGGAPCDVSGFRFEGECEAFDLAEFGGTVGVAPGLRWSIPIGFEVAEDGEQACVLAFEVNDPERPVRTVALTGRGDSQCLVVEPLAVEFAQTIESCGTETASVSVVNRCDAPVELESITLDGDAFVSVAVPPLPFSIGARSSISTAVAFRPLEDGAHVGGLRLRVEELGSRVVSLAGTADETPWMTDTFEFALRPKVDVLFVIDNGANMTGSETNLLENLSPFVTYLLAAGIDFHLGVTTTGLEPGGDCPGGVGGGEDGRLFPVVEGSDRILTNETPDLEHKWQANLAVGACRAGPNRIFDAAVRALTPPLVDSADDPRHQEEADGNAGFLRPGAFLTVIAVTDRDDESPESPNFYYNELVTLKGYRNTHLVGFLAVAGNPRASCNGDDSVAPGYRLDELVEKMNGGVFLSICESNWGENFRWLFSPAYSFPACLPLSETPVDLNGNGTITDTEGELELRLNGKVISSRGAQGQELWYYTTRENRICFAPLVMPEPGSSVEVRYPVACL